MKKKKLLNILTFVCALVCTLGLASCGDDTQSNTTTNTTTPSNTSQTVEVTSISLNKSEVTLDIGEEETLIATINPESATNKTITWSVAPAGIVSVANGKITALAQGEATVTATVGTKSATCSVSVNAQTQVDTKVVTKTKWVEIMQSDQSFTISISVDSTAMGTIKIDGEKRFQKMGTREQIYTKEGNEYFNYLKNTDDWVRATVDEDEYGYTSSYSQLLAIFKDEFDSFTYLEGVYTAQTIDMTESMSGILTNVVATFEDNLIKSLTFEVEGDSVVYKYEYEDFGTTIITIPTEYGYVLSGKYYSIETSEDGWAPNLENYFQFSLNNNVEISGSGVAPYEFDNTLIIIDVDYALLYGKIDGKILWLFMDENDIDDNSKAILFLYNGNEISSEDQAKIVEYFGDGISLADVKSLINFDKQGGIGGTDEISVNEGDEMPEAIAPTKDGYVFLGYFEFAEEDSTQYYDANMMSVKAWDKKGNTTLYAHWLDNTNYTNGLVFTSIKNGEEYSITGYTGDSNEILTPSTYLDKPVTAIGVGAFYENRNLTSIIIQGNVTSIGLAAFYGCNNLKFIVIPNSVTTIGNGVFYECRNLTSIVIPKGVTTIDEQTFLSCVSLTSIIIPDSVTKIGNQAFFKCSSLTSVVIPLSVNYIGSSAFAGCSSLTSIRIPFGVTGLRGATFSGCSSLTTVELPENFTDINMFDFADCTSLTSINIPNKVKLIAEFAFQNCTSLTSITLPVALATVGEDVFKGWTSSQTIYIRGTSTLPYGWRLNWNRDCSANIVWDAE